MISKLTHASIYVLDQESASDFYINKLGFVQRMKIPFGEGTFWLTVSPPDQPELELTLMPIQSGDMIKAEHVDVLTEMVKTGTFVFGVFRCKDIYATYQELKDKGVEFIKEPTNEFWGPEAIFKDDSGNQFSLGQFPEATPPTA